MTYDGFCQPRYSQVHSPPLPDKIAAELVYYMSELASSSYFLCEYFACDPCFHNRPVDPYMNLGPLCDISVS